MKRTIAAFLLAVICFGMPSALAGPVSSFDDLDFWVGSGANQTAFLLDWDGESSTDESLAWGYRWDGAASGEDMLRDILAADARLFAKISAGGLAGIAVYGLGYDLNDNGTFALDDGTTFDADGIHVTGPADGAVATDAGDLYTEGWFLGFWHLGTASTNPFSGGSWSAGTGGLSSTNLAADAWLSLAFTTDTFSNSAFAENPVAAEPAGPLADFDLDDDVDGADFLTWQRGFGKLSGATHAEGDADGNSRIDSDDLGLWQGAFGALPATVAVNAAAAVVPEPASLLLIVQPIIFLLSFRNPS